MKDSRRRWPLSGLVPWQAQVFVLLPFGLGLAAAFATVSTSGATSANGTRRQQERWLATLEAFFGGPGPGHEVRWMWMVWASRILLGVAVVAAIAGLAWWRVRASRGRGQRPVD